MKIVLLFLCLVQPLHLRAEKPSDASHQAHEDREDHADERHEHGDHEDHAEGKKEGHEEGDEHGEEGHEEDEEEFSSSIGPGNAVTAADRKNGLQLSDDALKTLGVKTRPVPTDGGLPNQAVVTFKDETGVYRLRDGWYKLIEGETRPQGNRVRFTPRKKEDLRPGDQIVVEGAPLLRVAELDAFSGGEGGHGH